jgi:hypothetical protein
MNRSLKSESRDWKVDSRRSSCPSRLPAYPSRHSAFLTLVAVGLIVLGVLVSPSGAVDQTVWQLTPYRVRIAVAGDSVFGSPASANAFCTALEVQLGAVVGAAWDLSVAPAPPALRWLRGGALESLSPESLVEPSARSDKYVVLVVAAENGAWQVTARELDVRTRRLGPVAVRTVWQSGKLRDAACDAVLETFAPLALIDSADLKKGKVVLRMKAGALPLRDPKLAYVRPGTLFQPILRTNDRDGNLRKADPLAWTVLATETVTPEQVVCKIYSGTAAPPISRRRGRMELLALAVRPLNVSSTVRVCARAASKPPLAGYEIYEKKLTPQNSPSLADPKAAAPDSKSPGDPKAVAPDSKSPPDPKEAAKDLKLLGRTDARGQLVIPPDQSPLRLLLVKNGDRVLTRPLPLVPGMDADLTAELPSDDARLQAEGAITSLQDELIDTMGRRTVLEVRTRAALKRGDFDRAEQFFQELRTLPDGQKFLFRLADEKKRLASPDRALQKQIDTLITEMQKLIIKHLTAKSIDDLDDELQKAKAGAKK